jgi:hypothetical protein
MQAIQGGAVILHPLFRGGIEGGERMNFKEWGEKMGKRK